MKYLTKEWYELMQRSDLHISLEVSKEAEIFSEVYFQQLYAKLEREWLELQEEIENVTVDDLYPEEFHLELPEGFELSPAEYEQAEEDYFNERARLQEEFAQKPPFDSNLVKENFKEGFEYTLQELKQKLPSDILKKVADIRVLALEHASAEVEADLRTYSEANEKQVEEKLEAYEKEYAKNFAQNQPGFLDKFGFHDCIITGIEYGTQTQTQTATQIQIQNQTATQTQDLTITLDNAGGFTDISQVTFKNASILQQDGHITQAWWLYEEIYPSEMGYEIHILLQNQAGILLDFIISTKEIILD